jgi:hypothetical protein
MLNTRRILGVAILLCTFASMALADQPLMRAARGNLQQARTQLQAARADKGGHRVKAIEHVNNAIVFVNQGIEWDRLHNHAERALSEVFNLAPDQPHMRAALDLLRQAKGNLERASEDKGGYRVKALGEVNAAIDETQRGIDAAN